jgi:hypothetical protein
MSLKLSEDNNSKIPTHFLDKKNIPMYSESPQHSDFSSTYYIQQPQNSNTKILPSDFVYSQGAPFLCPIIPTLQLPSFQLPKFPNFNTVSPNSSPSIPLPYYTIFLIPVPLGSSSRNLQLFLGKYAPILAVYVPPKRYYAFAKVKTINDVFL